MTDGRLSWPRHDQEEIDAVTAVLRSGRTNYWTGEEARLFEREFATWCGSKYAIAVANGTLALDLALSVLGIGQGDEVIVTPRSFIASASCVINCGATPVFADIDQDSQNITAKTVQAVVTPNTKALIAVHLAGWPCDMDPLMDLATENGFFVVEDCAQAHGAYYNDRSVGNIGHIAAWSFCQDKIMSTGGEGGMVTTSDYRLWENAWSFKDHGKSWNAVYERDHPPGFRWVHDSIGTNWRITEMQAALGRIQLRRLPDWVRARQNFAQQIWDCASRLNGLRVPVLPNNIVHANYKCYIFVDRDALNPGWNRDRIISSIVEHGYKALQGSCPEIYREKAIADLGLGPKKRLPISKELGETAIMFEVHPTLENWEIERLCEALSNVMLDAAPQKLNF